MCLHFSEASICRPTNISCPPSCISLLPLAVTLRCVCLKLGTSTSVEADKMQFVSQCANAGNGLARQRVTDQSL